MAVVPHCGGGYDDAPAEDCRPVRARSPDRVAGCVVDRPRDVRAVADSEELAGSGHRHRLRNRPGLPADHVGTRWARRRPRGRGVRSAGRCCGITPGATSGRSPFRRLRRSLGRTRRAGGDEAAARRLDRAGGAASGGVAHGSDGRVRFDADRPDHRSAGPGQPRRCRRPDQPDPSLRSCRAGHRLATGSGPARCVVGGPAHGPARASVDRRVGRRRRCAGGLRRARAYRRRCRCHRACPGAARPGTGVASRGARRVPWPGRGRGKRVARSDRARPRGGRDGLRADTDRVRGARVDRPHRQWRAGQPCPVGHSRAGGSPTRVRPRRARRLSSTGRPAYRT